MKQFWTFWARFRLWLRGEWCWKHQCLMEIVDSDIGVSDSGPYLIKRDCIHCCNERRQKRQERFKREQENWNSLIQDASGVGTDDL